VPAQRGEEATLKRRPSGEFLLIVCAGPLAHASRILQSHQIDVEVIGIEAVT
jgi:hypothetical protein